MGTYRLFFEADSWAEKIKNEWPPKTNGWNVKIHIFGVKMLGF